MQLQILVRLTWTIGKEDCYSQLDIESSSGAMYRPNKLVSCVDSLSYISTWFCNCIVPEERPFLRAIGRNGSGTKVHTRNFILRSCQKSICKIQNNIWITSLHYKIHKESSQSNNGKGKSFGKLPIYDTPFQHNAVLRTLLHILLIKLKRKF